MKEKSLKRSERRHHVGRLRKKRKDYHGYSKNFPGNLSRFLGMVVNTSKPCSCHLCGNVRRNYGNSLKGLTFKEILHLKDLKEFYWEDPQ